MSATPDRPVIGLGCQRSGTSVTGHILASPARSGFWMENGIMRMSLLWFGNALHDGAALSAARYTEFLRALMCRSESHGLRLRGGAAPAIARYTADGRLRHWIDTDDGISFVRQLCFDVLTEGKDVDFWGDKYPEHLFFGDDLRTAFPDARWLFVWREPAAVIEALSRKIIGEARRPVSDWRFSVEDCATQWVRWNRKWLTLREQIRPQHRLEVRFDTLVRDPQGELARVSELIEFDLGADRDATKRARSLRPGDLEKWRESELADEVAAQLEREDLRAVHAALLRAD